MSSLIRISLALSLLMATPLLHAGVVDLNIGQLVKTDSSDKGC